jgi:hypothetical protein
MSACKCEREKNGNMVYNFRFYGTIILCQASRSPQSHCNLLISKCAYHKNQIPCVCIYTYLCVLCFTALRVWEGLNNTWAVDFSAEHVNKDIRKHTTSGLKHLTNRMNGKKIYICLYENRYMWGDYSDHYYLSFPSHIWP